MKPFVEVDCHHRKNGFEPRRGGQTQLKVEFHFQAGHYGPSGRFPDPDRYSSIHLISRQFFRREFLLEATMFFGLVIIAAWPIIYMIKVVLDLVR
jgi:hypothetical protein